VRWAAVLCRAIPADQLGGFACRAITRDPGKDHALVLAAPGVEVVRADIDDLESLKKAFAGAHGVYGVTNFTRAGRKRLEVDTRSGSCCRRA